MDKEILNMLFDVKVKLKLLEDRVEKLENPLVNTAQTWMNIMGRLSELETIAKGKLDG